jgi:hypothetical protein
MANDIYLDVVPLKQSSEVINLDINSTHDTTTIPPILELTSTTTFAALLAVQHTHIIHITDATLDITYLPIGMRYILIEYTNNYDSTIIYADYLPPNSSQVGFNGVLLHLSNLPPQINKISLLSPNTIFRNAIHFTNMPHYIVSAHIGLQCSYDNMIAFKCATANIKKRRALYIANNTILKYLQYMTLDNLIARDNGATSTCDYLKIENALTYHYALWCLFNQSGRIEPDILISGDYQPYNVKTIKMQQYFITNNLPYNLEYVVNYYGYRRGGNNPINAIYIERDCSSFAKLPIQITTDDVGPFAMRLIDSD